MAEARLHSQNLELSTRYYQQDTLQKDLWFRVATRDYTELIKAFDFGKLFSHMRTPVELLDVGCGTGKFPSMLTPHLPKSIHVQYDYLDPSQHSLDELKNTLPTPFSPRTALKTTLEKLQRSACPSQGYQVIWCLQSLYCVQHKALQEIVNKLHGLLDPNNGLALIYLASSDACYHRLYNLYNQEFYPNARQPYITAEAITKTLDTSGISYEIKKLHFSHTISCAEGQVLKNYINQCVLDLNAWEHSQQNGPLKSFLESFMNHGTYQFPQQMWLIMFSAKTCNALPSNKNFML